MRGEEVGDEAAARSFEITVGDGVPQAGQNAAPVGISPRHEGQVSWGVTAPKLCVRRQPCNGQVVPMLLVRILLGLLLGYAGLVPLAWAFQAGYAFPAP